MQQIGGVGVNWNLGEWNDGEMERSSCPRRSAALIHST